MVAIISKIKHIIIEEGLNILIKRLVSFLVFHIRVISFGKEEIVNDWSKIEQIVHKKRIFILGNGPSLNKTGLHLLKGENVFVTNRFGLMLERLDFIPKYYSCIDDRVLSTISEEIIELSNKVEYMFLPLIHPSSGTNIYKVFKKVKNAYWLILNKFSYSLDLPYIGINKSVTNCSLQIAAYLGFTEIYLLGVDMNYEDHKSVKKENRRDWTSNKDDDPNHFDPRYFGKGTQYHHPRLDETFQKWEEAKVFFEKNGVKIFNSTVGGKLETFERVDLNDVINVSEKEEMLLFLHKLNIKTYISNSLIDYFQDAQIVNSEKEFKRNYEKFITNTEIAIKLIQKVIFEYIPYGPIFGQYLFIKREEKNEF
jgi:hypothetical protein